MADIFEKSQLKPGQMRTVADRRYDDAEYLRKSELNRHANGVYYLGGFVLECLLKAQMLEKFPELRKPPSDPAKLTPEQTHRFNLVYRWHNLKALLVELPELTARLDKSDRSQRLSKNLTRLCDRWTIFARYSPHQAMMKEASQFLLQIKELKKWLT